jgi:hypothetical protein
MFGSVDVVAQSLPIYGAFNHWWVLLWLTAMAGCLVAIGVVIALYRFIVARIGTRAHARGRLRTAVPTDGTSNP